MSETVTPDITARHDGAKWEPTATVQKFTEEAWLAGEAPYETVVVEGNLLLNAGIDRIFDKLIGVSVQAMDATHCRIGVGDSSTAAVASQTDLQASTNKQWKLCDSVARSGEVLTVIATFATGQANFAWNEWGLDVGTADGTTVTAPMINRKVASIGTKSSAAVWVFTVTATLT